MNRSPRELFCRRPGACGAVPLSLLVLLTLSVPACKKTPPAASEPRDAGVVFITLDTTRADHLSCYAEDSVAPVTGRHYRGARTPQLDALAARGVRFTHAIAPVPLTLPSHATMFTGTYPEVHQLRDMGGFTLDPKHLTLASMARSAGVTTAAFVGSKAVGRVYGLHRGFDLYDDQMPTRGQQEEGKLPGVFPERRAAVTTDRALDWLKQHGRERFFLWVHYYDPHEPYEPPEPYRSQYPGDPYAGEIAYTDAQVGRILEFLGEQNLRDRTLVIVVGDHGEGLNDHGESTHGIFIYDDTMRVPLIVAGPGVPEGKVVRHQARGIDLLPTVTEFLKLAPHPAAQGVSLWPLLERGQPQPGQGTNFAYIETLYPKTYMNWSELRGMRTDRWKFILAPTPELYDLEKDPGETENVIARHPAEADQLQKKIWEVIGPAAKDQKLAYAPVNRETRQELESLGYVSAGTPREIVLNMSGPDPKDRVATLRAMQQYDRAMKSKAYAQAARAMDAAVKNDAANPLARLYLATAYEKMRDWRRAIETYRGAVEINVATDEILSRLGKAYLRTGDRQNAVQAMEAAGRLNPTDLDNFRNLGTAYLELRRLPDAERAFRAILVQDERYGAAYNGLGLVAIERGDGDAARANFEKALEFDPEQYEAMLNLGVLFQRAGVKEQAIRYLNMFAEKAPRENYGHLLPQVREAIQELRAGT
jgi:choline-sulfatase